MQKNSSLLAELYLHLFAWIFHTDHESPIWKHFSKGLKLMAMDYNCFIPRESELLIQKNRAFDFIGCECVFINIYMLLWKCMVLCRPLRWQSPCLQDRQHNELQQLKGSHRRWKRKGNNRKQKKGNLFHEKAIICKAWQSGNLIPFGFYSGFVFRFVLLCLITRHGWDSA